MSENHFKPQLHSWKYFEHSYDCDAAKINYRGIKGGVYDMDGDAVEWQVTVPHCQEKDKDVEYAKGTVWSHHRSGLTDFDDAMAIVEQIIFVLSGDYRTARGFDDYYGGAS